MKKKETITEMIRRVIKEESSKGIKIVVCDETTFGYIDPSTPRMVNVLSSLITKGATTSANNSYLLSQFKTIRPATSNDFDKFRISERGYDNDPTYIYKRS